jgi:tripartite-type tricarboxylate transporter receptor subunit TctC
MRSAFRRIAAALVLLAPVVGASAQDNYPTHPITMVVGFAPGGGTDTVSRIIAKTLAENVGQQVVVDNKAGAGGNIAADYVSKAAPDGYTLLLGNVGSLSVAPHIVAKLSYDPLRDLAPVTMAVVFANVIVVHPSVPANTLAEFVQLAKDKPGQLTYGSSGIGGAGHLAGELLKMMAHIDIVHVPYKGGGPAMQGILGGQISAYFATPVAAGPHIRAGKARALATTSATRSKLMADVPTVAESGYPGYEATNWYAYVVPAKTAPEIVARLNRELNKVLTKPEVIELLHKQGVEPQPGTPEELGKFIRSEYQTWGKVVKEAKIQAN